MSKIKAPSPMRRSTRQSGRALSVELTPRGPLKRTLRSSEDKPAAIKGIREVENGLDDEESPSKKRRFDNGEAGGDGIDENEMEVQESAKDLQKNEDQEMDNEENPSNEMSLPNEISQPKVCKGSLRELNLSPRVVLGERCPTSHTLKEESKGRIPKTAIKEHASLTKSTFQVRPLEKKHTDVPIRSMADYKSTMEAKARSTVSDKPKVNNFERSVYPVSEKVCITRQRTNNIPAHKETVQLKSQEAAKKSSRTKGSSGSSCRGCMWYVWRLVFLLLLSSATLLAYSIIPVLQRKSVEKENLPREVKPEMFSDRLSLLKAQFPSQQAEFWKRIKIHLESHLKTANPTEPVSLIFTAGLSAERTLRCLANGLASAYSSALNTSVLHLDGKSKAGQDSDDVKLDIDTQLESAFEGDKKVAIIHQFEELPPGSTLIFYRYCDHENAAFKQVFLLFTVLLPQNEISSELDLKDVEELVQDYIEKKLVGSTKESGHNKMDNDKFSGLWSRISHLILPVVLEEGMEQRECP